MKRVLSVILMIVMLFSLLPFSVYAEEPAAVDELTQEEPAEEPAEEAEEEPEAEPEEEPEAEPEEEPGEEPEEEPGEEPEEEPGEEPEEEPGEEPGETELKQEEDALSLDGDGTVIYYPQDTTYSSLQAALNAANGGTVQLTADIIEDTATDATLLTVNGTVTLNLNGHIIKRNGSGKIIAVESGATLTLINSSLSSKHYFKVNGTGLWEYVANPTQTEKDAAVVMANLQTIPETGTIVAVESGVICGGGKASAGDDNGNGGGVMVKGGGTFIMEGGAIVGCQCDYGGGVYVHYNASFTMTGGSIVGCQCNYGGGGVLNHASVTMNGGTIAYNSTVNSGSYGGGIYNYDTASVCNITRGTIKCNTAVDRGGGVYNNGTLNFGDTSNTAQITGNKAVNGGGVFNNSKNCYFSGGLISANTASAAGGGIFNNLDGNTVCEVHITNTTISNNKAATGGGIQSNGDTTVGSGTMIVNNEATEKGGGIWINIKKVRLLSGTITGNTAAYGGGVYYGGDDPAFEVGGTAKVKDNTATTAGANVYLSSGKQIVVYPDASKNSAQWLTDGAEIYVYRDAGETGQVTSNTYGYAKYFYSDQGKTAINDSGYVGFVDSATALYEFEDGGLFTANVSNNGKTGWNFVFDRALTTKMVLKLLTNIQGEYTVSTGQTLRIDLNGHLIRGNGTSYSDHKCIFRVQSGATLELTNSSSNMGLIGTENGLTYGTGIYLESGAHLSMTNCQLQNIANNGNSSYNSPTGGQGAGIYALGGSDANNKTTLSLNNSRFVNCQASEHGGGIYLSGANLEATLINGCVFNVCQANSGYSGQGGGIYVTEGATLTMTGGELLNNVAKAINSHEKGAGGAVAVVGSGSVSINGVSISGNYSSNAGGNIIYADANPTRAADYNSALVTVDLVNCSVSGATGVYVDAPEDVRIMNATLRMKDCTFASNSSCDVAGVYIWNGVFEMDGGSVKNANTRGVQVSGASTVSLKNDAVITGCKYSNLLLDGTAITLTSALTEGANIWVTRSSGAGTIGTGTGAQYIHSSNTNFSVYTEEEGEVTYIKLGANVAQIGDTTYATIQSALDAANGGTIQLLADVSENVTLAEGKSAVLDLKGHTITAKTSGTGTVITANGALTLLDSVGTGNVSGGAKGVEIGTNGSLALGGKLQLTGCTQNLYLASGQTVSIYAASPLVHDYKDDDALIRVTMADTVGRITGNIYYSPYSVLSFAPDAADDLFASYSYVLDNSGEAYSELYATLAYKAAMYKETVYNYISAALDAAITDTTVTGDRTVTLIHDAEEEVLALPEKSEITDRVILDLAGHTISGRVHVKNLSFTIKDSSEGNTGKIIGTLYNAVSAVRSSLILDGVSVDASGGSYNKTAIQSAVGSTVTVTGNSTIKGDVYSVVHENNPNEIPVVNLDIPDSSITDSSFVLTAGTATAPGTIKTREDPTAHLSTDLAAKEISESPYLYEVVGGNAVAAHDGAHGYVSVQKAIDHASGSVVVTMMENTGESIVIAQDKTVDLELNGRTLTAASASDTAITVNGALTLLDSVGTGNVTGGAKGVAIGQGATLTLGGQLNITGNTQNLYLADGQTVSVDSGSPLFGSARIGVSTGTAPTEGADVAVTNANGADFSLYFVSDTANCKVISDGDKAVKLSLKTDESQFSVRFNPVGGEGTGLDEQTVASGAKAVKPADPTRNSLTFGGWLLNGRPFDFDTAITDDIILTAKWILSKSSGTVTVLTAANETTASIKISDSSIDDTSVVGLEEIVRETKKDNPQANVSASLGVTDAGSGNLTTEQQNIMTAAKAVGKDGFTFLSISLKAQIGTAAAQDIEETNSVLEIIVPVDMSTKKELVVYRAHGTGDPAAFTKADTGSADYGKDATYYIEGSGATAKVHFFSNKFSDYAMAYVENDSGVSLTLDGSIGVNFYVDAAYFLGDLTKYPNAYVKLYYPTTNLVYGDGGTCRADSTSKEYLIAESSAFYNETDNIFKFSAYATSGQMTEKMKVELYDGVSETPLYTREISVAAWCQARITNQDAGSDLLALCEAILDYGYASQTFFKYVSADGSMPRTAYSTAFTSATDASVLEYLTTCNSDACDVIYVSWWSEERRDGITFMALSNSAVRIYYNSEKAGSTVESCADEVGCSNSKYGVKVDLEKHFYEVSNIPAAELHKTFTLYTGCGNITACGLSYAKKVLTATNADQQLKDLSKALVLYNQAAVAYFK